MSGYVYAGANPLREVDPEGLQRRGIVMTAPWNPLINEPDGAVGGGGLIIIGIGILAGQGDRASQEAGSGMLPHAPAAQGVGAWLDGWLFAQSGPIYAGTNEVQRNIIAERMLGMPR